MHTVAVLGLMVDPRDLGQTLGHRSGDDGAPEKDGGVGFDPTVFLYDHAAGGVGLAPRLFQERETLLRRTRTLIAGCPCGEGCPACIGPDAGMPDPALPVDLPSRKKLALELLRAVGVTEAN